MIGKFVICQDMSQTPRRLLAKPYTHTHRLSIPESVHLKGSYITDKGASFEGPFGKGGTHTWKDAEPELRRSHTLTQLQRVLTDVMRLCCRCSVCSDCSFCPNQSGMCVILLCDKFKRCRRDMSCSPSRLLQKTNSYSRRNSLWFLINKKYNFLNLENV